MLFKDPQVSQFVDEGDEKGILIQVMVNTDPVVGMPVGWPVIAQFGLPASGNPEMYAVFDDPAMNLVNGFFGEVLTQNLFVVHVSDKVV
jgi:hypothetical protein